jgi:arylsulfatase A-like enzyme
MFGPKRSGGDFVHTTNEADRANKLEMSSAEIQMELNTYDGAIAYIDHHIGRLFDELGKRNVLENTLVLITSDHGEQFGEHGLFGHSNSLYLPTLHVPLLIMFPSHIPAGISIAQPISLRNIPATVVDLVGLGNAARFPGESFKGYWDGTRNSGTLAAGPLLSEINQVGFDTESWYPIAQGDLKSLVIDRYHYIRNGEDSEELYDFRNDPLEEYNLVSSGESRPALEQFRVSLETLLARNQLSS